MIGLAIIVVILAAISIGVYYYLKNEEEEKAKIETEVKASKEELNNILPYGMDGKGLGVVKGRKSNVPIDINKSIDEMPIRH